jgi:hypothetical protein
MRLYQLTGIDIAKCSCWGIYKKSAIVIPW